MNFDLIIDAAALQALLASGQRVAVFDASFDLADTAAGRRHFNDSHIAGARYLHLDDDLSGPKPPAPGSAANACGGRHPLPSREVLAGRLGAWGIDRDTQVVVYDRAAAPFTGMCAVRLWGLLRWAGHRAVAVLDGGFSAWLAQGGALASGEAQPATPVPFVLGGSLLDIRTTVEVQAAIGRPHHMLLDARMNERFTGAVEPMDPVAGHIPGARNRFFGQNIQPDGPGKGRFKPAGQLRAEFEALLGGLPGSAVVNSCGSGVTALHNLLALELAGLSGSSLYGGSWSEWCSDPARPVATSV